MHGGMLGCIAKAILFRTLTPQVPARVVVCLTNLKLREAPLFVDEAVYNPCLSANGKKRRRQIPQLSPNRVYFKWKSNNWRYKRHKEEAIRRVEMGYMDISEFLEKLEL